MIFVVNKQNLKKKRQRDFIGVKHGKQQIVCRYQNLQHEWKTYMRLTNVYENT
jgi:hypothetical protein